MNVHTPERVCHYEGKRNKETPPGFFWSLLSEQKETPSLSRQLYPCSPLIAINFAVLITSSTVSIQRIVNEAYL